MKVTREILNDWCSL